MNGTNEEPAVPGGENSQSRPVSPKKNPLFPGRRRSGSLTIIRFSHRDAQCHDFWWALCDCRKREPEPLLSRVRQDHFLSGRVTSCGCRRRAMMLRNRRARKQSGRTRKVEGQQAVENKPLVDNTREANLILGGARAKASSPPTCQHGFKLIKLDFDRGDGKACYCELCGLMNDTPPAPSTNWDRRLAYENLAMTRGMAPSIDSPTSPRARKFSTTADKVWVGGKNNVPVGGPAELGIVDGARQIAQKFGGRRRSASDKCKPWQNPNVDYDGTADTADSRVANHYEPGHRDVDHGGIDRRVAKKTQDLLDEQTFGLDDCYGDRDEKALLKNELGEKAKMPLRR